MEIIKEKIALAIQGNQSAYKYLLERFWADIHKFQKSRINNQNEAEDITIQTFAKAFSNLRQYDNRYDFKNWLLMISKNVYIDSQRRKKNEIVSIKESKEVFQLADHEMTSEDRMILEQNLSQLKASIKKLKPHYRDVIELRYFHDLSYKEIAKEIDEPINNVKIKLLRAKKLIGDIIKQQ